jgi:hypothetical protein
MLKIDERGAVEGDVFMPRSNPPTRSAAVPGLASKAASPCMEHQAFRDMTVHQVYFRELTCSL